MSCQKQTQIREINGDTMGTTYKIRWVENKVQSKQTNQELKSHIDRILQEYNQEMSTYIPTSKISQFNTFTEVKTHFRVNKHFIEILDFAKFLHKESLGRYDITIAPLVNLWGFGPVKKLEQHAPSKEVIDQVLPYIGLDKIDWGLQETSLYWLEKKHPMVQLDFSSVAKGQGVDVVSDYLEELGILNYMVEIGGEIRVKGRKGLGPTDSWKIGVEVPTLEQQGQLQKILDLSLDQKRISLATSGNYRNFFKEGEKIFGHTINPKTGQPEKNRILSATVVSFDNCMTADAWATTLMAVGELKAKELIEKHHLIVYLILSPEINLNKKSAQKNPQIVFDEYYSTEWKKNF